MFHFALHALPADEITGMESPRSLYSPVREFLKHR